jgi:hypothetical protein
MFIDDLEFGWRVSRADYRIRTAPEAVIFHAEATWRGTRRRTAGDVPHWEERRAALYTLLANTSRRRFWWQYVRLLVGSMLRFFGFALSKDPESASDELLALRAVYFHPFELRAARRDRAAKARRSVADFRDLFPPFWLPYRHGFDAVVDAIVAMVKPESFESTGRRSAFDDDEELVDDLHEERPSFFYRHPWLVTAMGLIALAFIAGRGLYAGPDGAVLHGGSLPPAPGSVGDWWRLLFERTHTVGMISTSIPPIFVLPLALASTPLWAAPGLVVSGLMVLAVPLAGLTAHRFGRHLMPRRLPRIVWAVSYAMSVAAIGAVPQGRIGTVVALIVLPIVANTTVQLVEDPKWQVGVRLGVWIAVASAFAPIALVISLLGLGLLLYVEGRWVLRDVVVAVGTALLMLGPWLVQRAVHPLRMWWEAGFPMAAHVTPFHLLLGRDGGPGSAPVWFNIALPVIAALAIVPRRSRNHVLLCWVVALGGLVLALAGNALSFTSTFGAVAVPAWVGVPVVIWVAGLLTAVMLAAPEVLGLPRTMLTALTVAVLLLPVGLGAWWIVRGSDHPIAMTPRETVPTYLASNAGSTLVVTGSVEHGADLRVIVDNGPFLGQEALAPDGERSAALRRVMGRIMARPSRADVAELSKFGISAIYAPNVDPGIARRIDGAPGLRPAGSDSPNSRVWMVPGTPAVLTGEASQWRWLIGGSEVAIWLIAIVLTAPVHRRRALPALDDGVDS